MPASTALSKFSIFICFLTFIVDIILTIFLAYFLGHTLKDSREDEEKSLPHFWYYIGAIFTAINTLICTVFVIASSFPMFECFCTDKEDKPLFTDWERKQWYRYYSASAIADIILKFIIDLAIIRLYNDGSPKSLDQTIRVEIFGFIQLMIAIKVIYDIIYLIVQCHYHCGRCKERSITIKNSINMTTICSDANA